MVFADKIKELRKEKGYSQTRLAEAIGVPLRTYRSWETEGRFPKNRDVYIKLSEILGCNVSFLMDDESESPVPAAPQETVQEPVQFPDEPHMLLSKTKMLFVQGSISEAEQLAFINDLKDIYMAFKLRSAKGKPTDSESPNNP